MDRPYPKLLLTGKPGVGKTTVIKRIIEEAGVRAGGFYTEEIRKGGRREGFHICTLRGDSGVMAHVSHPGPFRVGRYGVDVDLFERIVLPTIEDALNTEEVIIIDEIGRMELFSNRFRRLIERVLKSDRMVLAVIHGRNDPFTQRIRKWPRVEEWTVTERNRDLLPTRILTKLNLRRKGEDGGGKPLGTGGLDEP